MSKEFVSVFTVCSAQVWSTLFLIHPSQRSPGTVLNRLGFLVDEISEFGHTISDCRSRSFKKPVEKGTVLANFQH